MFHSPLLTRLRTFPKKTHTHNNQINDTHVVGKITLYHVSPPKQNPILPTHRTTSEHRLYRRNTFGISPPILSRYDQNGPPKSCTYRLFDISRASLETTLAKTLPSPARRRNLPKFRENSRTETPRAQGVATLPRNCRNLGVMECVGMSKKVLAVAKKVVCMLMPGEGVGIWSVFRRCRDERKRWLKLEM